MGRVPAWNPLEKQEWFDEFARISYEIAEEIEFPDRILSSDSMVMAMILRMMDYIQRLEKKLDSRARKNV